MEEVAVQQQRAELEEVQRRQEQQSESLRLESEVPELKLNLLHQKHMGEQEQQTAELTEHFRINEEVTHRASATAEQTIQAEMRVLNERAREQKIEFDQSRRAVDAERDSLV